MRASFDCLHPLAAIDKGWARTAKGLQQLHSRHISPRFLLVRTKNIAFLDI